MPRLRNRLDSRRPTAVRTTVRAAVRATVRTTAAAVTAGLVGVGVVAGGAAPASALNGTEPRPPASSASWFAPGAVWRGDFGDPTVVRVGGTYYAYASPVGGRYLPVLESTDLVTWRVRAGWSTAGPPGTPGYSVAADSGIPVEIRRAGMSAWDTYDMDDALVRPASWGVVDHLGPWIARDYWAPGVFSIGATWYAYSPVRVSPTRFCLTVATAPSPVGPFRDVSGAGPIQCQPIAVDPGGSIDPFPYHDAATGRNYLLWKASGKVDDHPSSIMSVPLGANGLPLPGAVPVKLLSTDAGSPWEGSTIENPSMVTFHGTTYLFYSANLSDPLDAAGRSTYASGYAICPAGPTAPCHRAAAKVPLLSTWGSAQGPGGSSAFLDTSGGLRMAFATFFLGEDVGGPLPHPRRMGIATLVQGPGLSLHVVPGTGPVSPLQATWSAFGGAGGVLGAATTPQLTTADRRGLAQHFRNGAVYWSPASGVHVVQGAIAARWAAMGFATSPLGYPTSDEHGVPGRPAARRSDFQHGTITWGPVTGVVVDLTR